MGAEVGEPRDGVEVGAGSGGVGPVCEVVECDAVLLAECEQAPVTGEEVVEERVVVGIHGGRYAASSALSAWNRFGA